MDDLIREFRNALEFQLRIQGPLVPLGDRKDSGESTLEKSVENASTPPPDRSEQKVSEISKKHSSMANQDLFGNPVEPANDLSLSPYERIASLIPPDSPLHGMNSLEEVEEYVRSTIIIPLDKTRLNPVFGVGNPQSDLMVIGEAPGADEDRKGEPFVGRAGQLLNKILAAINFRREDIYIANILKSRPPDNRNPLPEEVEGHLPILYKQIALIQPKIILCVGKTAGNNLLKRKSSLSALRGKFQDFHGIPVMVTYHPAALLRNPQWKRPTWEDVQMMRTKYDQITQKASNAP